MTAFCTLKTSPLYPISPDGVIEDGVIRSPAEGGYEQTRPRFTRARRTWGLSYIVDATDLATLRAFEWTTVSNGADLFTWTHPVSGVSYTVRLAAPIQFALIDRGWWRATLTLREV